MSFYMLKKKAIKFIRPHYAIFMLRYNTFQLSVGIYTCLLIALLVSDTPDTDIGFCYILLSIGILSVYTADKLVAAA